MIKNILILVIVTISLSCGKKEEKIPENILSKEKMKNLLIGIHILEGVVNTSGQHADTAAVQYKVLQDQLFAKHGIKQIQFDSSMAFYSRHLGMMDEIYTGVIDSITVKEALGKIE
jgi:hypothetical protein